MSKQSRCIGRYTQPISRGVFKEQYRLFFLFAGVLLLSAYIAAVHAIPYRSNWAWTQQTEAVMRNILVGEQLCEMFLLIPAVLFFALFFAGQRAQRFFSLCRDFILSVPGRAYLTVVFCVALGGIVAISYFVYELMPRINDSVAMLFQAKLFSQGMLFGKVPERPEFFTYDFILMDHGKWYGKYFPGHSLVLMAGNLLHMPWIINPLQGALTLLVIYCIVKSVYTTWEAKLTVLFGLFSPFFLFLSASHMSHPTSLLFSSLFILFGIKWIKYGKAHYAFICGICWGLSLLTRPYDCLAVSLPVLAVVSFKSVKGKLRYRNPLLFFGVASLFAVSLLLYNMILTGDAFLPPFLKYDTREIPSPGTFKQGLIQTGINLFLLNKNLFGWGGVCLVFLPMLFLKREKSRWDLLFLAIFLCNVVMYAFYYLASPIFGARFYYVSLPALLILSVRGINGTKVWAEKRNWSPLLQRHAPCIVTIFVCLLFIRNFIEYTPHLAVKYHRGYLSIGRKNFGVNKNLKWVLDKQRKPSGVFFLKNFDYGAGLIWNDPSLCGERIFARDLGYAKDRELLSSFPGKEGFVMEYLDKEDRFAFFSVPADTFGNN